MPSHRSALAVLALVALAGHATAARSLAQAGSAQPLAEAGGLTAAAAAPAAAPASTTPVTACTVTAASAVNRTEVDGSHAVAQGPMFVPDAFLGQALLTVSVPAAAGSTVDVEVVPADGHTPAAALQQQQQQAQTLASDDGSTAAAAPAPAPPATLRLTATLAANGSAQVSYPARSYANDLTPRAVTVNGVACDIVQASAAVPPLPPPTEETIPGLASFAAARPLTTRNGQIIGTDGKPLIVKGINWFGFENGQTSCVGVVFVS
jgi:hypothetical protein